MGERELLDEVARLREQVERATQQVNALNEMLRASNYVVWPPPNETRDKVDTDG
mgnify:CR=1 FL=1